MIDSIKERLDDATLDTITTHFRIDKDTLHPHDGFCSFVYEGIRGGAQRVILKISHSSRLSIESLRDELAFVTLTAELGARVCSPLSSSEDVLVIEDGRGERFLAYLYEHVAGASVEDADLDQDLVIALGEALGSFHAASRQIDHARFEGRRSFLEQELVQYRDILPADEADTIARCGRDDSWRRTRGEHTL